jgi:hypothetical protein
MYSLPEKQERKLKVPGTQPPRIQEGELDVSDLESARELLRVYEAVSHERIPGVRDPRVINVQLSIGFYMCAVTGVQRRDNTKHPTPTAGTKF